MTHNFWYGKRVFLTGHTGFKGSWLSLWLQNLGAEVTGYALDPTTTPNLFKIAKVGYGMTSIIADIRDLPTLQKAMQSSQPDIVIHMAAQPLVRESYRAPVETYATNVMGSVHLLEAVRHTPSVKAVVNITTDKCYENREWVWGYRENEAMGGYDPYSNSKSCAELVTSSYRNSFFNPASHAQHGVAIASARAGNVIGGGDWSVDRLIPDMIRAFESGQTVKIRSPNAIRPWQHVLEPLSGYLQVAERLWTDGTAYGEAWNFGPDEADARPVAWIADRLVSLWGGEAQWKLDGGVHPHEANYLKLDCAKARSRLGWFARWTLTETIARIVAWHKALHSGVDMRNYTLSEISSYPFNTGE